MFLIKMELIKYSYGVKMPAACLEVPPVYQNLKYTKCIVCR